jgi:tRNA (guanine37-N1)-methyltransferase
MLTFHLITIFPEIFNSYLDESILQRAQKDGKIAVKVYNLRDFAHDKHKTVDDTAYGGGPGMVLKVEPIFKCVEHIKSKIKEQRSKCCVILTSAKGREYSQAEAENLNEYSDIIIICGRYEGVDERVAKHIADEEFSIGKYVLTGGELPALVIVDSVARLIEGVLGNKESLASESYNEPGAKDYPVYSKPAEFNSWEVPEVLQSGNHGEIKKWREKNKK